MGRQHESEYDIEIYDQVYLDPKGGFDESDWRLIVTTSTANSYLFLAKYFDRSYCDMSAQKKGRMLIVLNQHYPESVLSTDILDLMTETAGDSLFPGLFLYDELIRESAASGLPLLEYAPYSANQPLFELLGNHVVSQHAKHHAAA
jgi:cellulose biosynthesis protein BcsQ